jgi:hypothetical protein
MGMQAVLAVLKRMGLNWRKLVCMTKRSKAEMRMRGRTMRICSTHALPISLSVSQQAHFASLASFFVAIVALTKRLLG